MPICIAGMHRSGTSMVSRVNNLCGLYLGPESELSTPAWDNKEGFWENAHFVAINDRILAQFDAGWDLPPTLSEDWRSRPEITTLRTEAAALIDRFLPREPWGWKDPRNSLTLPFWTDLIPSLQVLICVRNPLEVAQSLHARNFSSIAFGLKLWLAYNQRLLSTVRTEDRVVTHYDSYFHDPGAEVRRVLDLLSIPATDGDVERACLATSASLRHQKVPMEALSSKLPPEILKCYLELCAQAGPVYEAFHRKEGGDVREQLDEADRILEGHSRQAEEMIQARLDEKNAIITGLTETIADLAESLKAQVDQNEKIFREREEAVGACEQKIIQLQDALSQSQEDRRRAADLSESLKKQVETLNKAIPPLQDDLERSERKNELLLAQLSAKADELDQITQSLGWRVLSRYGKLKYRHLLPLYRVLGLTPNSRKHRANGSSQLPPGN